MALPRFTADNSVYRSRRQYRTEGQASAFIGHGRVVPQQNGIEKAEMTIPGFTTELYVNRAATAYRPHSGQSDTDVSGLLVPAIPISPDEWYQMCHLHGCGAVMMPDGSSHCVCY